MGKRYLYHKRGKTQCGGKALVYLPETDPDFGVLVSANDFEHLDGRSSHVGELMVCGTCGRRMDLSCIEDIAP